MARIFLCISLIISIGTCYLSFLTKGKVSVLQADLGSARSGLSTATASLKDVKGKLQQTEEKLTATTATIEEKEKEIAAQKADNEKIAKDLVEASNLAKQKTEEMAAVNGELGKLKEKLGAGNPEELVSNIEQLKGEMEKAKLELAEASQARTTMEQQKRDSDEKLAAAQKSIEDYKSQYTRPGLTGKIMAYNPGWNFVVVNLGDKQGMKANAQLLVMRGSQTVAKVKVTNVEPASSIADIIPGSLSKSGPVQPGDAVIFEGR
jgi:hypothetical protein